MMAGIGLSDRLVGSEIHGFRTLQDLDVGATLEEARTRWLRPNEIHAMLCNYRYFTINVKPVNLPKSGTVVLFDRKMLRNFRKDGHNWKKKKDGKTVKEAHEHLKVGDEERIHVYYAHGLDNPTFVRRCYWLLDKTLEHIVLVHYRETQELQDSPGTPVYSNSSSVSDHSNAWPLAEEFDSGGGQTQFSGGKELVSVESLTIMNHQMRLHEINTLEWDELVTNDVSVSVLPKQEFGVDDLPRQDSFGRWINYELPEASGVINPPSSCGNSLSSLQSNQFLPADSIFVITDVSPSWAFSTETTKILISGYFPEQYQSLSQTYMYCICGDQCFSLELVQTGVYRCYVSPHSPGLVNLCLSFDGRRSVTKFMSFEYRDKRCQVPDSPEEQLQWEDFLTQMRLLRLLLPASRNISSLSAESPEKAKDAKKFSKRALPYANSWAQSLTENLQSKTSFEQAKSHLFEFTIKNLVKDWLLGKVLEGCKTAEYDSNGQGVIHLCAMLGYTWAVQLFKMSKLSLDFRDKRGWTALHWASFCGKEKMVGTLLSLGANANRVTDPTAENPGGCNAADLASSKGYDGLAAFLSEKALVTHFNEMSIAGNVTGTLQNYDVPTNSSNLSEEDVFLKNSLAAYRTAADAAARIQSAFREHSLKVRTDAVAFANPEEEARGIVAAMKIQHAYRNFETRKKMAAAARIQYRFRTWKIRQDFLKLRSHAIKIQAAFRGYQARRQYRKIVWSVGVLEKAILRWRLKRKGFRGLQVEDAQPFGILHHESDAEEDFYKTSRKQAEERVERSVVRVQAMFRSKKAQAEYQRMKMAHSEAKLEIDRFHNSDDEADMETS